MYMPRKSNQVIICKYIYYTSIRNIREFNWVFRKAKENMFIMCDCKDVMKCNK